MLVLLGISIIRHKLAEDALHTFRKTGDESVEHRNLHFNVIKQISINLNYFFFVYRPSAFSIN